MSDAVPESREAALRYWAGDDRNFLDNPACHAKTKDWLETYDHVAATHNEVTRNPRIVVGTTEPVRGGITVPRDLGCASQK